jgi:hypothetical protein
VPDLYEVQRELDELAGLEPDWDSYGAQPMDLTVLSRARQFVEALGREVADRHLPWRRPSVCPGSDGSIAFSWESENYWRMVHVLPGNPTWECVSRNGTAETQVRSGTIEDAIETAIEKFVSF